MQAVTKAEQKRALFKLRMSGIRLLVSSEKKEARFLDYGMDEDSAWLQEDSSTFFRATVCCVGCYYRVFRSSVPRHLYNDYKLPASTDKMLVEL